MANRTGWQPTIQVISGISAVLHPGFLSEPRLAGVLPGSLIEWYRSPEGQWFHDELLNESEDARSFDVQLALAADRVKHATGYLAAHRANLLFGTDTPSAPTYANPPGLNAWLEIQRLSDAGVTPGQIFRAATLSNA